MPLLTWPSKTPPGPVSGDLQEIGSLYPRGIGYPDEQPGNRLILGDNLNIMSALLKEYEGSISLIYADPPFFSNRSYPARIGRGEDSRKPKEWRLAEGYPDSWKNIDAYLDMLYSRLGLMYRLLAPNGTLYLHLDWHANAYARLLLDEIFGPDRLLNEIVWVYHGPSPIRTAFNRKHDTILVYTKSDRYTFNVDAVRQPYDPSTVKTFASSPKAGFGKMPDLERGKVPEDWWYFPVVARLHRERTGYPTQKPEALLERIVLASSNPGDLTADFFCGSGTFPAVASRLGRNVLASDLTWQAFHTTRARLAGQGARSFTLQQEKYSANLSQALQDCTVSLKGAFSLQAREISIELPAVPELDYWEVDPAWDGSIFRSAAQAVRPPRRRAVPSRLDLPCEPVGPVCVRLVSASGEHYQVVLSP